MDTELSAFWIAAAAMLAGSGRSEKSDLLTTGYSVSGNMISAIRSTACRLAPFLEIQKGRIFQSSGEKMMDFFIIPISLGLGLITLGLIARWYLVPLLDRHSRERALLPLLLPHCFRYIGLSFLVSGVVADDLAAAFAQPAAYGDLLAALLALIAVIALRRQRSAAIALVWIFNVWGTLDLLNALLQGLLRIQPGQLGGAFFIPALIVPALLVSHYLVFRTLTRPASVQPG